MKAAICQRARELGFDDCRFTTAAAPASGAHFENWLAAGRNGEMAWLARNAEKRLNPQLVLPGARNVIVLAISYSDAASASPASVPQGRPLPTKQGSGTGVSPVCLESHGRDARATTAAPVLSPSDEERGAVRAGAGTSVKSPNQLGSRVHSLHPDPAPHGLVARYARHTDYHDVLSERLRTLTESVNQLGGADTRSIWYVDTGPVLERDFAQRTGLGFVGKHTNVVSRRHGNWLLLAEILTTLELAPDPPERNRCGSCTRCLAACPTGALVAPFQLDARRCISYLTIELKGSLPLELRPAIGNRIFGCDDCLAACPWNRFARDAGVMKTFAQPTLATPDLLELLALDDAGFKSRFRGTPLLRAKRRGLLRNVCVALGNIGDRRALPALARAAVDAEPLIREHAEWAIGQIESRWRG